MSGLQARALLSVAARLSGYTEWEPGLLTRELEPGCHAWVGVMTSQHSGGELVLTPNVGMRHGEVEDALAGILQFDAQPSGATVVMNVGYLMPSRTLKQWRVSATTSDRVAVEIADAVRRFAEPFARRCLDLEVLQDALREYALLDERLIRDPVIAVLRRDDAAGSTAFSELKAVAEDEIGSRATAARERRMFVARFPSWAARRTS
jgi:hypothetical protein